LEIKKTILLTGIRFENQTDRQLISQTTSYTAFCIAECNLHVLDYMNAWHCKVCTFVILNISKLGVMVSDISFSKFCKFNQIYQNCSRTNYNLNMLARSQYSEGPATGHLDKGFSWFPCAYKQMLRWFPTFQVATKCFSCSPPDLNSVVTDFIFCIYVK
jgi:hypothetical protein